MASEIIRMLAPEVLDKTPQQVWNGPWTSDYPNSFDFGASFFLEEGTIMHQVIGRKLNDLGLIPPSGPILDLGCGPTSDSVYGKDTTQTKVYGVDYAKNQLRRSVIAKNRRFVADLRSVDLKKLIPIDEFSLISAFLFVRYLTITEATKLYSQLKDLGKKLVVVDYSGVNSEFKQVLGEQRIFNREEEKTLLGSLGFSDVGSSPLTIPMISGPSSVSFVWGSGN